METIYASGTDNPPEVPPTQPAEPNLRYPPDIPLAYHHAEPAAISNLGQTADHGTGSDIANVEDEGIAEGDDSDTCSVSSSCFEWVRENDREYPNFGQFLYGLPIDKEERERLDLQHTKYLHILDGRLCLAPIGPSPQQILDLGTGTGIWAMDFADECPSAVVIGVDIAPIQPEWVPPNCKFQLDDVEDAWTFGEGTFDFIHGRDLNQSIRDWRKVVRQAHRSLKKGGWLELSSEHIGPYCDDSSLPSNSALAKTCALLQDANDKFGTPAYAPFYYADYLRQQGFVKVVEKTYKIPLGRWPRDRLLKKVGAFHELNLTEGATAFGLRVFQTAFGWSKEQTETQMASLMEDVRNRAFHTYSV